MKKPTVYERTIRATPINKVDWDCVSRHVECQDLSLSFIREYADYLNWHEISNFKLTTEFIREFKDRLDWWLVCESGLNERKIKEFKNKFDAYDWQTLSDCSKLSKKFIMRNAELVNWDMIFWQEHLGKKFMIENQYRFSDDVDINWTFRDWGIDRDESSSM